MARIRKSEYGTYKKERIWHVYESHPKIPRTALRKHTRLSPHFIFMSHAVIGGDGPAQPRVGYSSLFVAYRSYMVYRQVF